VTGEQRLEQAVLIDGELQEQWTLRRMMGVRPIDRNGKSVRCVFCGDWIHTGMEYTHTGTKLETRRFAHSPCYKAVLLRYPVLLAASEDR
jgi:hypothetical protein